MDVKQRDNDMIIGLDVIRFLAAFLVLWFHLAIWSRVSVPASDGGPPLEMLPYQSVIASHGWVGVEIFFVLSGIVIAYSAEKATAWTFLRSRILRIAPTVWICAPISFVALAFYGNFGIPDLLAKLGSTLVLRPMTGWIDIVYWTLNIEICFYSAVLAVLFLSSFERIGVLFGALSLLGFVAWGAYILSAAFHFEFVHQSIETLLQRRTIHLLLVRHGCLFAVGGFIWLCLFKGATFARLFLLALAVLASMAEVYGSAMEPRGLVHQLPIVAIAIWAISVCAMALSIRFNDRVHRFIGRNGYIFRTIGLMTFPVYLLHDAAGVAVERRLLELGVPPYSAIAVTAILVLATSAAIVLQAEPRVRSKMRFLLDLGRSRLTAPSSARPAV